MLNDFLAGKPIVEIAQERAMSVREVLEVVNAPEARETMNELREASRAQCSMYLQQQRTRVLQRLAEVALHPGTLGIDISTPGGACVLETIRKSCAELLRCAAGVNAAAARRVRQHEIVRQASHTHARPQRAGMSMSTIVQDLVRSDACEGRPMAGCATATDIERAGALHDDVERAPATRIETTDSNGPAPAGANARLEKAEYELDELMKRIDATDLEHLDNASAQQLAARFFDSMRAAALGELIARGSPINRCRSDPAFDIESRGAVGWKPSSMQPPLMRPP